MTVKKSLAIVIISMVLLGLGSAVFARGTSEDAYGAGRGSGAGYGRGNGLGTGRGVGAVDGTGRGLGNADGVGQGKNSGLGTYDPEFHDSMEEVLAGIESSPLSASEKEGIMWMREEEKLARDVYTALYTLYGVPVFRNIAESEQTHMDSMAVLIERYGLTDPVGTNGVGVFSDPELQKLYNDLTAQAKESLLAAAQAGAAVEELDIADLEKQLSAADNDDVKIVYLNLLKGSRNHLRSFAFQIDKQGGSYSPVYLGEAEARAILEKDRETGTLITDPNFQYN